jgi:ADP-ribosyl-[dinitrogen reductase] hydrolase
MKGSCLCGAVAFEAEPPATGLRIGFCSCPSCRKAHAAPFNAYASVPRAGFRWRQGLEQICSYSSSPGKQRRFCGVCGSQLMAEHTDADTVILRVAVLDEDPGARPVEHIFQRYVVPWCDWRASMIARHEDGPPR